MTEMGGGRRPRDIKSDDEDNQGLSELVDASLPPPRL